MVKGKVTSGAVADPQEKRQRLAAGRWNDIVRWKGELLDAGSELLPHVHAISTVSRSDPGYEPQALEIWRLLRECWRPWWNLYQILEPSECWEIWQRCTGAWEIWRAAGLADLVKHWMERGEPPYQITHEERLAVFRFLYGTPHERAKMGPTPLPFWVAEMVDTPYPGFVRLLEEGS